MRDIDNCSYCDAPLDWHENGSCTAALTVLVRGLRRERDEWKRQYLEAATHIITLEAQLDEAWRHGDE